MPDIVQCNIVGQMAGTVKPLWYRDSPLAASNSAPPMPAATVRSTSVSTPRAADLPVPEAARPAAAETFTISDLAREFALTTRAIRFYEDEGLLSPLRRGRARIYSERERVRIKLILRGKRLGLALSEIRELFDLYATTRNERPQLEKFLVILADRRSMLVQQREDIDAVLVEIAGLERDCRRRLKGNAPAGKAVTRSP
jgi:DNA-binding transcriptional MerR regulator